MLQKQPFYFMIASLSAAFLFSCKKEVTSSQDGNALSTTSAMRQRTVMAPATVTTFATGFNNPRELKFGPDGNLYVAEAGIGGTTLSTTFDCAEQAPVPFGPYHGSPTGGRVSKVDMSGTRTTVTEDIPTATAGIGDIFGATDVGFVNNTLYVLTAGGGCSHGNPTKPNGIYRVNADGSTTLVANLSAWTLTHPVANPEEDDFEPDGNWYSMAVQGNQFYALDANHADFVKVSPEGSISRVLDISAVEGHIVPTAIDNKGNFYIGNLGTFPIMGNSKVLKINAGGHLETVATNLFTIIGLVLDQNKGMFVLEMATGPTSPDPLFPTPNTGKILYIDMKDPSQRQTIATGLDFPTGMTMGPDGNLYVSARGFGHAPGEGMVMKVTLH
jgi:hypothetical protein